MKWLKKKGSQNPKKSEQERTETKLLEADTQMSYDDGFITQRKHIY